MPQPGRRPCSTALSPPYLDRPRRSAALAVLTPGPGWLPTSGALGGAGRCGVRVVGHARSAVARLPRLYPHSRRITPPPNANPAALVGVTHIPGQLSLQTEGDSASALAEASMGE